MLSRLSRGARNRIVRAYSPKRRDIRFDRPTASITFDDFPKNAWTAGGEILERHGARGTYYVSGGYCGRTIDGMQYFDRADLAELHRNGHEIGCHTFDHAHLPGLSAAETRRSLERNAAFVEDAVGARMATFAYPYGETSISLKRMLSSQFAGCRGVAAGFNGGRTDLAQLRAMCLERHVLERWPIARMVAETVKSRGWLVVLTHDVSPDPTYYGCRPELLTELVQRLTGAGVEIAPVSQVLSQAHLLDQAPPPETAQA